MKNIALTKALSKLSAKKLEISKDSFMEYKEPRVFIITINNEEFQYSNEDDRNDDFIALKSNI